MARPVSAKVEKVRGELEARLRSGLLPPGEAFFSARQVAERFGLSYQTAHRLLSELAEKGLIERRPGAGTFVTGEALELTRPVLIFRERAAIAGSFGWNLLLALRTALIIGNIEKLRVKFTDRDPEIQEGELPVLWEVEGVAEIVRRAKRPCLLLNDHPPLGGLSRWLDTIAVDDRAGGQQAGELLAGTFRCKRLVALGGPEGDRRSRARLAGFLEVAPGAEVFQAGSWGERVAPRVLKGIAQARPQGVFCANDRLALRVREEAPWLGPRPRMVGFDDAPIAQEHQLTTIAIPWIQLAAEAYYIIKRRLEGDRAPAIHRVLVPQAIVRS